MTNMTISPMQLGHVRRDEFGEFGDDMLDFKTDTEIRLDNIDTQITDLKKLTMEGFEGMDKLITNSFSAFEDRFDKKIDDKFSSYDIKLANNNRVLIAQLDMKFESFKTDRIHVITSTK